MTADSGQMAELLAKQYSTVFSTPSNEPPSINYATTTPINNIHISKDEIDQAIDELKPNAAPGPDGVSLRIAKVTLHCHSKFYGTNQWRKGISPAH